MAKVYAKLKKNHGFDLVIDLESEYNLKDTKEWTLVDKGRGIKYSYPKENYLDGDTLIDKDGFYKYKYVKNDRIVKLTDEELNYQKNIYVAADKEFIYADGLENEIVITEIQNEELVSGLKNVFIAIFDNNPSELTTINNIAVYKKGAKSFVNPEIKADKKYIITYSENNVCYFIEEYIEKATENI